MEGGQYQTDYCHYRSCRVPRRHAFHHGSVEPPITLKPSKIRDVNFSVSAARAPNDVIERYAQRRHVGSQKRGLLRGGVLLKRSVVACTTQIIFESKRPNIGNLPKPPKDAVVKQEFLELAAVCEEVANEMDDRRASG
jgi:hypothetical protein